MDIDRKSAEDLRAEIRRLNGVVTSLSSEVVKRTEQLHQLSVVLGDCMDAVQAKVDDIFGRIKNLEVSVFPNLVHHLDQVNSIIKPSDDEQAGDSLDRRQE